MPVSALKATSTARNGVGAFILQCKRLDFHYCDWAGSSKGMNSFLRHLLRPFAIANPSIEIHVSPRPHAHPVIRAHYINSMPPTAPTKIHPSTSPNHATLPQTTSKAICVRNLAMEQILQKAEILRDASGSNNRRVSGGKTVGSLNESVRGIWSPLHGDTGSLKELSRKG